MSRKKFIDALNQKAYLSPAVGTCTSIVCEELMQAANVYFPDAHLNSEKMARLAQTGHGVLNFDVVMPLFSVCHEISALGGKINWGTIDSMPYSENCIYTNADDIIIPADFLKKPSCQVPLKAIKLLKKNA